MPIEWKNGVIDIGLVSTESVCLIICRLEGVKAKKVSIDTAESLAHNVYNCLGGAGTSTVRMYDHFGPVKPGSNKQFIVSLFKEDSCPASPNAISTPYKTDPSVEVHFDDRYKNMDGGNVDALSKTFNFKVADGDHFFITITIEDVGT